MTQHHIPEDCHVRE